MEKVQERSGYRGKASHGDPGVVLKTLHVRPEAHTNQLVLHILHKVSVSFLDGFEKRNSCKGKSTDFDITRLEPLLTFLIQDTSHSNLKFVHSS